MVVLVVQFGQLIPLLKALGLLILIISVWTLHHDMGHKVKTTVKIGAVALWYQFLWEKF